MSGRFSIGEEAVFAEPERNLALAVLERAVWDLSRVGPKSARLFNEDAYAFLYGEEAAAHRLMWCNILGEDGYRIERLVQYWGRRVIRNEAGAKHKSAAFTRKYA